MADLEKKIGAINLLVGDLERSKDDDTAMFRFGETSVFLQRGAARQGGWTWEITQEP